MFSAPNSFLDGLEEILGLVLIVVEVEVAGDARRPHAEDVGAGKQVANAERDHATPDGQPSTAIAGLIDLQGAGTRGMTAPPTVRTLSSRTYRPVWEYEVKEMFVQPGLLTWGSTNWPAAVAVRLLTTARPEVPVADKPAIGVGSAFTHGRTHQNGSILDQIA